MSGTDMTPTIKLLGQSAQEAEPAAHGPTVIAPESNYQAPAVEAAEDPADGNFLAGLSLDGAGDDPAEDVPRLGLDGTNDGWQGNDNNQHSQQARRQSNPTGHPQYMPPNMPPPWMYHQPMMNPYAWPQAPYPYYPMPGYPPPMMPYHPPGPPMYAPMSPMTGPIAGRNFSPPDNIQPSPARRVSSNNRSQPGRNNCDLQEQSWGAAPAVYVNVANPNAETSWNAGPRSAQPQTPKSRKGSKGSNKTQADKDATGGDSWGNDGDNNDGDQNGNGPDQNDDIQDGGDQNNNDNFSDNENDGGNQQGGDWPGNDDNQDNAQNDSGDQNNNWQEKNGNDEAGGSGGDNWNGPSNDNNAGGDNGGNAEAWPEDDQNKNNDTSFNDNQQQPSNPHGPEQSAGHNPNQPPPPPPPAYGQQEQPTSQGVPRILNGPFGIYHLAPPATRSKYEPDPIYDIPDSFYYHRGLSHQVRPGDGYPYWHKKSSPTYLDTLEEPYARFLFLYRGQEALQTQLGEAISPPGPPPTEEEMAQLQKQQELLTDTTRDLSALSREELEGLTEKLRTRLNHPAVPGYLRNLRLISSPRAVLRRPEPPPETGFLGYRNRSPEITGLGIRVPATQQQAQQAQAAQGVAQYDFAAAATHQQPHHHHQHVHPYHAQLPTGAGPGPGTHGSPVPSIPASMHDEATRHDRHTPQIQEAQPEKGWQTYPATDTGEGRVDNGAAPGGGGAGAGGGETWGPPAPPPPAAAGNQGGW